jgi:hypothetical protein
MTKSVVVVPWVSQAQLDLFLAAWGIKRPAAAPDCLLLQHDAKREGCAVTKNRGIAAARELGAEVVVVLDDDCYPDGGLSSLEELAELHAAALAPQRVRMFEVVTDPPSRGTPYGNLTVEMPVAASMGFWSGIGDYCAVRQLATGAPPMEHRTAPVFGRYFPLCGMNLAFRPAEWSPWCNFIDVPRFDDIWMGWLWQREAYRRKHCFNLAGPVVRHARQSNPWRNLAVEARHLQANETLWAAIASSQADDYEALRALLPLDAGGSDR